MVKYELRSDAVKAAVGEADYPGLKAFVSREPDGTWVAMAWPAARLNELGVEWEYVTAYDLPQRDLFD